MTTASLIGMIGQISRTVSDIKLSETWYREILDLPHLYTFGQLAFFNCAGTRLMLTATEGLNTHESILYFQVDDIERSWHEMQKKGVEFINAPHRIHEHEDGTEEWMAFFKDPDGRPLGLMSRTAGTQEGHQDS